MTKPDTDKTQTPPKTPSNPFASFFDRSFAMPFGPEMFFPWLRDHASRIEKISDEVAAFERAMMERLKANAADVAALVQDTLDYMQQVGAEWRKIAIDTARRAADAAGRA
jgi:hypothetical protein